MNDFKEMILIGWMLLILFRVLVSADEGIDTINRQTTPNDNKQLLIHKRNKRDACRWPYGVRNYYSCYCGNHCWKYEYCDSGQTTSCCTIKNNGELQPLFNCPVDPYFDFNCTYTDQRCYDGSSVYDCTCSQPTSTDILLFVLPPVLISLAFIAVVAATFYNYVRINPRQKKLDEMVENGYIPIRCNVMVLVDNQDEFEYYSAHVMAGLREIFPSIVCESLTIHHLLNDNYQIKCDKLLVFRRTHNHAFNGDVLKDYKDKIVFRKGRNKSVFVVCVDSKEDEPRTAATSLLNTEVCVVDGIKNLQNWLPRLVLSLFRYNTWWTSRDATYCVDFEHSSFENEYCQALRKTVEDTLLSCGAVVRQPLKTARFKLVFRVSVENETEAWQLDVKQEYFTFVSSVATLDQYRKDKGVCVYGCREVIHGIVRLLFEMKIMSCQSISKVKGVRYNPLMGEFM